MRSSAPDALAALDDRIQAAVAAAVTGENARWRKPGVVSVKTELVGDRPAGQVSERAPIVRTARAVGRALNLSIGSGESSSDANLPMSLGIPAITIGAGGRSADSHAITESFDLTDAWRGTQNALLLAIALARP
mgnify:FL=1